MKSAKQVFLKSVRSAVAIKASALFVLIFVFVLNTKAQVEFGEEDSIPSQMLEDLAEPDTVLLLDSNMQGNTQVVFDSVFNYNFIAGLAKDSLRFRAGLLYDLESNTVVWQKDMNYAYPIASVTKMMTGLLTIQDIQKGIINWNDKVDVTTQRVVYSGRRKHRKKKILVYHNTYTLRDLLKMTLIESNNYAAELVARHAGGGDLSAFIKRMNDKAVELKMNNTFYGNPSGLPGRYGEMDNSSSPHDLLLLAKETLRYPEFMEITSMGYANVENGNSSYTIRNHNGLVRDYVNEVDGIKTGFTRNAGFCLVASAKRYDHRLLAIGLGFPSVYMRNQFISDVINNYYQQIGLGLMGTVLSDSVLQAVKPGFCNDDYNYGAAANKFPMSVRNDFTADSNSQDIYKTVIQQQRKTHVVRSGETLTAIAHKYSCTTTELKKWNKMKSATLKKGQRLTVMVDVKKVVPVKPATPTYASRQDSINKFKKNDVILADDTTVSPKQAYSEKKNYFIHVVQSGDTLWNIAQRYNVDSIEKIKRLNNITRNQIKVGQRVKVPKNS
ncbi:MAG: LysM peptidoglycan-binding domain-containing protein [Bacteroidia bacterium]